MSQIEDRITEILIKKFQGVGFDRTIDSLTIRDIRELVDSICKDINERTVSRLSSVEASNDQFHGTGKPDYGDTPKEPAAAYRRGPPSKPSDDDEPPF